MEPENSLPFSQGTSTELHLEPDEFAAHLHALFLEDPASYGRTYSWAFSLEL
jgi:hypothetical protein